MQAFQPLQEQLDDLKANQEYLHMGKDTWQPGDRFKTYENYTTKDFKVAVHCNKEYANPPPIQDPTARKEWGDVLTRARIDDDDQHGLDSLMGDPDDLYEDPVETANKARVKGV